MLTCKEASQLASKAMDAKLAWRERLRLGLHLAMCGLCRRYVCDIKKLRLVIQKLGKSGESLLPDSIRLSERSRERIQQALDKAGKRASGNESKPD